MTRAYYNEIDAKAAQTIRECIADGLIAPGDVDERSISDVQPEDLKGYTQCHFFAGFGVWSAALRLAGWPDDRPVWTASCPCQDFSVAGKGQGTMGERDLWPDCDRLIRECRPEFVFGEQVENAIGFGWLDRLCADLEAQAYTVGQGVLGAHSAGADHIRQRLFWVGVAQSAGLQRRAKRGVGGPKEPAAGCPDGRLDDATTQRRAERQDGKRSEGAGTCSPKQGGATGSGCLCGRLADLQRQRGRCGHGKGQDAEDAIACRFDLWQRSEWHYCRDGKQRRIPTEPRLFPLADARTHKGYRVAALRGAGNAINIGAAAAFIEASMQAIEDTHEGDE